MCTKLHALLGNKALERKGWEESERKDKSWVDAGRGVGGWRLVLPFNKYKFTRFITAYMLINYKCY